jgi:hypothetical protein
MSSSTAHDDARSIRTDDDDLPVSITHARDKLVFGGKVEQDYRTSTYRFNAPDGEIEARVYFDDTSTISILTPYVGTPIDAAVLRYMQQRFRVIKQLGGPEGYATLWEAPSRTQL